MGIAGDCGWFAGCLFFDAQFAATAQEDRRPLVVRADWLGDYIRLQRRRDVLVLFR